MIKFLLPIYTALASRLHGGGFIANVPRQLRNFIYAAPYFGYVYLLTQSWHAALPAFVLAFVGIDLGHYEFWYMGAQQPAPRDGAIAMVLSVFKFLAYGSLPYCIIGMAIKGAFIGAGTLSWPVIVLHALAWPVAYLIGMRAFKLRNDIAEALSGLFCGAALLLYGVML